MLLVLSHGQATVDRGFSINKRLQIRQLESKLVRLESIDVAENRRHTLTEQ